jgi:tripartite-type tricarboxylate transporter receptor subunit TctC
MLSLRRTLISRALRGTAALLAGMALSTAMAQPAKPLRILVGFPPGGGTDAIARSLSDRLKDALGVPVVVENRPGAGGQIAAQVLKASPPDGTTVFLTHDHTISILPLVVKNPGYEPEHDFVPVGGFATFVNAFAVSGGTLAKTFGDYVQWIRTQGRGKGAVGIPAPASTPEFLVKLVGQKYHLDLVSAPYRGAAPMMADMLGNQIGAGVGSVQDFMENHKAGKLHVVAVLGTKRQAAMPNVPTFDELGLKGFEDLPYYGFYAPAGTSQKFITQFSVALAKVVAEPEVREHLTAMGLTVGFMTPQQLAAREQAYTEAWRRIIKSSGFVPQ